MAMKYEDVATLVAAIREGTDYQCNVNRSEGYYKVLTRPEYRQVFLRCIPEETDASRASGESRWFWEDVLQYCDLDQLDEMKYLCKIHGGERTFAKSTKHLKRQ